MAKPYSQDLRDRVIGAVDSGISARAASRLFGISESTGIKWGARWRRTGSIGAKRMGGYKRSPLDSHVDLIVELITEQSDLTVEELRSALRERGIRTGHGSVRRFFDRHGISFKKTVLAGEQDRADVAGPANSPPPSIRRINNQEDGITGRIEFSLMTLIKLNRL